MSRYRGIDVSEHQGVIDWQAVAASGIDFVIVRAGYGENTIDLQAHANVAGALAAGLRVGLYWFSYPGNDPSKPGREGKYLAEFAAQYPAIDLPLFYDLEDQAGLAPTWEFVQACATNFCEAVKAAGYDTGIYCSASWYQAYYNKYWDYHPDYYKWIASWGVSSVSLPYDLWQYSDSGTVPGIGGGVDVDYWDNRWPGTGPGPDPHPEQYRWFAKEKFGYDRTSSEAQNNAVMMYRALYNVGWERNAVAGVLGNVEMESQYNPWRWQSDNIGGPSSGGGYGLFQFTPAGRYINDVEASILPGYDPNYAGHTGTPDDGNAQVLFMDLKGPDFWLPSNAYKLTWDEFKTGGTTPGGSSPENMASAFLYNYEKPADPAATEAQRQQAARYWYTFLETVDPNSPDMIPDIIIYLAAKMKKRRWFCR